MHKTEENTNAKTRREKKSSNYDYLLNARKNATDSSKPKETGFEWLTEHSRNFLAAGYVPQGITPETRIKEISDRAEKILGIKGFSNKFFNYMKQGFFSLSSAMIIVI